MRNNGLPKGVAYACLAETIVLPLEGRFERLTISRHLADLQASPWPGRFSLRGAPDSG